MKMREQKAGGLKNLKKRISDRKRSVTNRVIAIAHVLRYKGAAGDEKRKREYRGAAAGDEADSRGCSKSCKGSRCHDDAEAG